MESRNTKNRFWEKPQLFLIPLGAAGGTLHMLWLTGSVCDSDLLLPCAGFFVFFFRTRTVFVGQTAGGEFFAMRACVVLQVRGARGPT